jgi:hypothetical protein
MVRGTPIDAARYDGWVAQFSGYRNGVTNGLIEIWLNQFDRADRDLSARLLDAVLFIGHQQISESFRSLLNSLGGWSKKPSNRVGRWFFVPFSGSTGESGDSMVHVFRMANGMTSRTYDKFFIHRSELVANRIGPNDTVVLIDDFSGSGSQVEGAWPLFSELLTGGPRVVLLMIAATDRAIERIRQNTEMEPWLTTQLGRRDDIFDAACSYFTPAEKAKVLEYCERADNQTPKGFGNCGLLIVFAHRCPNNSLPIFHVKKHVWRGLFPRHNI